jgi:hypothetical protein
MVRTSLGGTPRGDAVDPEEGDGPSGGMHAAAVSTRSDELTTFAAYLPFERAADGSAGLLVERVTPVPLAVLLHLEALAVVHLGLVGDVVAPLALGALEGHVDPLVGSHLDLLAVTWPRSLYRTGTPTADPSRRVSAVLGPRGVT